MIVALHTCACLLFASQAPVDHAGERAFEAGMDAVRTQLGYLRWDVAGQRIHALLAEHAQKSYVLLRRPELVDALTRVRFWTKRRPPELGELIAGDLVSWKPKSGLVELRYTPDQLQDFWQWDETRAGFVPATLPLAADARLLFPATFVGPHRIEIEGDRYASGEQVPLLSLCAQLSEEYVVTYGFKARQQGARTVYLGPGIWLLRGDEKIVLTETTTRVQNDERYSLTVDVGDATISSVLAPRDKMEVEKPRGRYGSFGLSGFGDFTRLKIEGRIEPAWLEGVRDAATQESWLGFLADYDPNSDLPEWLHMERESWEIDLDELPEVFRSPAAAELVDAVVRSIELGLLEQAERLAAALAADSLAGRILQTTLASRHAGSEALTALADELGREQAALGELVRRLHVLMLAAQRDGGPAREQIARVLERNPRAEWAHAQLARLALYAGDLAEVDRLLEQAVAERRYTPELEHVNRMLTKSRLGPTWREPYEHATARYVVRSDISRQLCLDAARELDAELAYLEKWVRRIPPEQRSEPFAVYIFSGLAGYSVYARDVLDNVPHGSAGLYSPWLRQLLIWNLPQREELMNTVRHEGFHQYMHRLTDSAPTWLNEGLAEVWGSADFERFDDRRFPVIPEHAELLQRASSALVPLAEFLYMDHPEFMSNPALHYAQAWSLTHMMYQDSSSGRRVLLALIDQLMAGRSGARATEIAFERQDLEKLHAKLFEYVQSM